MSIIVPVSTKAPMPKMHKDAAVRFESLRENVRAKSGVDFLAVCGDVMRSANFTSEKDGVVQRSWHKTGRAFDYDQDSKALVIVSEPRNGKQYFRTYLKCAKQDGSLGERKNVKDYRGNFVNAYLFDFTAEAERFGFKRIPAWNGWQKIYNRREFWHYQFDEGLTWDTAMAQLRTGASSSTTANKVWGLNDRDEMVRKIQSWLASLGFLPGIEVDGVFGAKTKDAVIRFQKYHKLSADGLVGIDTYSKLKEQHTLHSVAKLNDAKKQPVSLQPELTKSTGERLAEGSQPQTVAEVENSSAANDSPESFAMPTINSVFEKTKTVTSAVKDKVETVEQVTETINRIQNVLPGTKITDAALKVTTGKKTSFLINLLGIFISALGAVWGFLTDNWKLIAVGIIGVFLLAIAITVAFTVLNYFKMKYFSDPDKYNVK